MRFIIKVLITALVVAGISELAKRYSVFAAVLASLPLTSILALIWLYLDTGDTLKVADLSYNILWAVIPSMIFFVDLPVLVKLKIPFFPALGLASTIMVLSYAIYVKLLSTLGVRI